MLLLLLTYFSLLSSSPASASPLFSSSLLPLPVESPSLQTSLSVGESRAPERLLDDQLPLLGQGDSSSDSIVLAPSRTYRKDPLDNFRSYTGGWNISNRHYWASVGYTAAPFFVAAAAWFVVFGLCLSVACVCCCCSSWRQREPQSAYSRSLSFAFLALFSVAAVIGCVILYNGQGKFHKSTISTLEYVVRQADATSNNLRNVSEYLSAAKQITVDQVSLPPNSQSDIDQAQSKIDSSATTLTDTTRNTSQRVKNLIQSVSLALVVLTALMLLLTFLGLVFSILGVQIPVYILVISAWILVAGALILCGIVYLLRNVTGDTCAAMNQWVQINPPGAGVGAGAGQVHHTGTALDEVLGCVDNATVQEAFSKTKQVTSQLVDVINTVISNLSNINFAPSFAPMYYNQSGPLVPSLCNPFHPDGGDLTDRSCAPGEVDLRNATEAWSGYVCQTSPAAADNADHGVCVTPGRLTPRLYAQMAATINVSYGLYQYGPLVAELGDCSFVRLAFSDIDAIYCPTLRKYSRHIYVGLAIVAVAVLLSATLLLFWVWVVVIRAANDNTTSKGKWGKELRHHQGTAGKSMAVGVGDGDAEAYDPTDHHHHHHH
ncbi:uncharacterized protein LOC127250135 isoform X2 [Andrographis paniculata]|uniref:uncharacterized protein LOC127250135 isoform X2 n=1 Tax=Andrographis paniculata TaxID=175694 RepID=UPI0021E85A7F|nr:uncharacterized protein LOC127250135 isoform X2 [Andrographis paniculata]